MNLKTFERVEKMVDIILFRKTMKEKCSFHFLQIFDDNLKTRTSPRSHGMKINALLYESSSGVTLSCCAFKSQSFRNENSMRADCHQFLDKSSRNFDTVEKKVFFYFTPTTLEFISIIRSRI